MQIEDISDYHCVFIRIPKIGFISSQDNKPKATAFSNTPKDGDNLSCDWCKYCSAHTSRELISRQKKRNGQLKNPLDFNIWKFNVGKLKNEIFPKQLVLHNPIFEDDLENNIIKNIAHSIIVGQKPNNAEFRISLLKIGEWALID